MTKKLSELELETIAGGFDDPVSTVVDLTDEDEASSLVALTGPIV
jgi:hypothetical protein